MTTTFRDRYLDRLIQNTTNAYSDNFAEYRYPNRSPGQVDLAACQRWTRFILDHVEEFETGRNLFVDDRSREIYDDVLQFNSLGHLRVRHARNRGAGFARFMERIGEPGSAAPIVAREVGPSGAKPIHVYELVEEGIRVACRRGFLANVIFGRQYFFERDGVRVQPEPGDTVLDCGGGLGDTAVLFANRVGPSGRVFVFEFVEENQRLSVLNRGLNPELADRIVEVPLGVWSKSGEALRYEDASVSTRVSGKGSLEATSVALDDFVAERGIEKVDFIKMDVEGAERDAIAGAARTLREHAPRLAISAYHLHDDLYALPRLIRAINPEYGFWLDHHTIHREETVVYASV